MRDAVEKLWPELQWIANPELREQVTQTWIRAFELSPLEPQDLNEIPFTLLVPDCPATFMEHKRCVVHIARKAAEAMQEFLGKALKIDLDRHAIQRDAFLCKANAVRLAVHRGNIVHAPIASRRPTSFQARSERQPVPPSPSSQGGAVGWTR